MANWKQTIDFADLMEAFEQTEDSEAFAKKASERITKFIETHKSWTDRNDITGELEDFAENLMTYADDTNEIDCLLGEFYDLADYARIWVKTF